MDSNQEESARRESVSQLISADTFAKKLNLSKRTLYRLKSKGLVPSPIQIGGLVRWRLDIVEEWIKRGCPAQD